MVYALLVQAPPDTFAGAISMGFCPDLPIKKPFCKGNGLEAEPLPKGKGYNFYPPDPLKIPGSCSRVKSTRYAIQKARKHLLKK